MGEGSLRCGITCTDDVIIDVLQCMGNNKWWGGTDCCKSFYISKVMGRRTLVSLLLQVSHTLKNLSSPDTNTSAKSINWCIILRHYVSDLLCALSPIPHSHVAFWWETGVPFKGSCFAFRLINHTKKLMEKEEKLCIKILQTLREMLEKKDSFVEEVFHFQSLKIGLLAFISFLYLKQSKISMTGNYVLTWAIVQVLLISCIIIGCYSR